MPHRTMFPTTTEFSEGRSLHGLDLDDLLGGSRATHEEIAAFFHLWIAHAVEIHPGDQVVVAASKYLARRAWFALPSQGIQRVVNYGTGGGAQALLEAIDIDHVSRRFTRLIIGSGNAAFADLASAASRKGLVVHQVTGRGGVARTLTTMCTTSLRLSFAHPCGHGLALAA